jgi:hypothetical protein
MTEHSLEETAARRSRSDAIRQLVGLGLDRSAAKARQPKKPREQRSS